MYTYTHTYTYIHTYTHIILYIHIHINNYIDTYLHIRTCMHTYLHKHKVCTYLKYKINTDNYIIMFFKYCIGYCMTLEKISKDLTINIVCISNCKHFNDIRCLVVQGASVLILLVIGLSLSVVLMGVCLCQVKYKKCDC